MVKDTDVSEELAVSFFRIQIYYFAKMVKMFDICEKLVSPCYRIEL
jgi:hypothetical protein